MGMQHVELFENGKRTSNFSLTKDELDDAVDYHIALGKLALREEKSKGNLLDHNTFVDGKLSPSGNTDHVKFGGRIVYEDLFSLTEIMDFIDKKLRELTLKTAYNTGNLLFSQTWYYNGKLIRGKRNTPKIIRPGDQLVTAGMIRYAKYQESGTVNNKAKWLYKKTAASARREFGRSAIITHHFIQGASFRPRYTFGLRHTGRRKNWQYSPAYYKERWKNSFPAIKIVQKRGVKYN